MIVFVSRGAARLAVRIKEIKTLSQLVTWEPLQLCIAHSQTGKVRASPWFFYGWWPGVPTGVDINNQFFPDVPTVVYNALDSDEEGRIVFKLDHRFFSLPNGRYHAEVRAIPRRDRFSPPVKVLPPPEERDIPPEFIIGRQCGPEPELPPPPPPHEKCCILARFEIELGPECSDNFADQIAVDYHSACGVDNGDS